MRSSVRFQLCSCAASGPADTTQGAEQRPEGQNSNVAHSAGFYACSSARDQRSRCLRPASRPSAFCINSAFDRMRRLDGAQAQAAQRRGPAGQAEQAVQAVESRQHREVVALALALVAAQHLEVADVLAGEQRVLDDGRDRGCIEKSQVHALPRERVHGMRSVAEQRDARRGVPQRVQRLQREADALRARRELADDAGARRRELGEKLRVARREQALGFGGRQRPDDRAAAVGERQQRERAARQEPLPRRLLMRARARHVRDDGRLLVAMARDGQVEQPPHGRVAAVGGEQHACRACVPPSPSATTTSRLRVSTDSISAPTDELRLRRRGQALGEHGAQQRVLDDVAEIGLADVGAVEVERARRVGVGAFPDAHAPIRRGARLRDALPHADVLEELLRRARQRIDARVHLLGAPARQRRARRARARAGDRRSGPSRATPPSRARRRRRRQRVRWVCSPSRVPSDEAQAARQARQPARLAHRLAREQRLRAGQQVERHEPQAAAEPDAGRGLAEQLDQAVRERRDALPIGGAPRRVALEQLRGADVGRAPGSAARSASAMTSASVATSRSARLKPCPATGCRRSAASPISTARSPWIGAARDARERIEVALADAREAPEPLAERGLQLRAKSVDGQRRDPLGVAFGQRPDHGARGRP